MIISLKGRNIHKSSTLPWPSHLSHHKAGLFLGVIRDLFVDFENIYLTQKRMQQALNTLKNLGDLVENVSLYYTDDELRKMVLIDPGKDF